MKFFYITFILFFSVIASSASAQVSNDLTTQNAIVQALPDGLTPKNATADEIGQAALTLAFSMEGDLEANLTQVMISLGELTLEGTFENAPRFGVKNPTERFYIRVLNLVSSNLDVASSTYYGLTVQDITRVTAAMREGSNFLNDAKSNAITRK